MQIIINIFLVIVCIILLLTVKNLEDRVESLEEIIMELFKAARQALFTFKIYSDFVEKTKEEGEENE